MYESTGFDSRSRNDGTRAIVGAAIEHLRRGKGDQATVERALVDHEHGAQRMNRLVDDLLLLARADAEAVQLVRVPADLAEVTTDAVADFAGAAAEHPPSA